MKRNLLVTALAAACLFGSMPAFAQSRQSTAERIAADQARATTSMQARQVVEQLFSRLCPGRCELVELEVEMNDPTPMGEVVPGFETVAGPNFTSDPKALNVTVLLDSKLPRNFQSNLPRLIRYRLQNLAPIINVRPEVLDFPEPQLEPTTPFLPEPPRRGWEPPPQQEPVAEPLAAPAPVEPGVAEEPVEPSLWDRLSPLLAAIAPWIGPILMVIVMFLLLMMLLRRLSDNERSGKSGGADAGAARGRDEVDTDALRAELSESRSVRNAVLRRWISEDEDSLAELVFLLGPQMLGDLKSDASLSPALERVSERVARQREALRPDDVRRLTAELRARLIAARITHDEQGLAMDWEFLEGLGTANLRRIFSTCSGTEKIYVVGQLPGSLRSAYLETLDATERRDLVLGTSANVLTKSEAIALAARLRKAADEFSHIGKEADGQAVLIVDMLRALHLDDQLDMLRELKGKRPEVAQAVLDRIVLETTALQLPPELIADAVHRTDVATLASFLRGTRPDVRDHLVAVTPASKRQAVLTELSLDVPMGRSEFLEARDAFMGVLRDVIRRDGHDIVRANSRALLSTSKINPIADEASV